MKILRYLLFAAIVVTSSATLSLGGEIQFPGKSEPPPPLPASATTIAPTADGTRQPTSTEEIQIVWQDASTTLVEILLTIL